MYILLFVTFAVILLGVTVPNGITQTNEDITALSFHVFSEIAQVYHAGGEAPELVSELNTAIALVQEAKMERLSGNETGAFALEGKAGSIIADVLAAVPAEQQRAQVQSLNRKISVIASIPPAVGLSTIIFVVGLKIWRRYERSKLFEMRIIEGKSAD